jgi:acyl-CoA synthetase (AMP-forming)/AMP-acid ligase II
MIEAASLQAVLRARLERTPGERALAFLGREGTVKWQLRDAFHARAAAHAARLAEQGLGAGDVCIIVLPSGELSATLLLACLLCGAVPLLVAPPTIQGANSSLSRILAHTISKTRARIVICPESMANTRVELGRSAPRTRLLFGPADLPPGDPTTLPTSMPRADAIAAMQLTSGTTGLPRICVWKQESVLAALAGMAAAMKLSADDVCLNWTPLYHDMGLVNNFFLCLAYGVPLAMINPQEFVKRPVLWLRGLSESGATVTWSPNFGFGLAAQRVTDAEMDGVTLGRVRGFWNAAERIHLETMLAFHRRFASYGVRLEALKTNFGCAENIGGATFSDAGGGFVYERIDATVLHEKRIAQPVEASVDGARVVSVVGVGRPVPGMRVRILSRSGRSLPDGHVGEIALETPSRMLGYLRRARETRRALRDGWLRTGDLGYLRGEELFWTGRVRERITLRGKKLDPSDFEQVLLRVAGLRHGNFTAFGVEDAGAGTERVVIVAELRADTDEDPQRIVRTVRDEVYAELGVAVSEVVLVPAGTLTKTSSGKRRHRHFRDLYLRGELESMQLAAEA